MVTEIAVHLPFLGTLGRLLERARDLFLPLFVTPNHCRVLVWFGFRSLTSEQLTPDLVSMLLLLLR